MKSKLDGLLGTSLLCIRIEDRQRALIHTVEKPYLRISPVSTAGIFAQSTRVWHEGNAPVITRAAFTAQLHADRRLNFALKLELNNGKLEPEILKWPVYLSVNNPEDYFVFNLYFS